MKNLNNLENTLTFKVGDEICHWNNYKNGIFIFFIANSDDVKNYSGKNGSYYRKINKNI